MEKLWLLGRIKTKNSLLLLKDTSEFLKVTILLLNSIHLWI